MATKGGARQARWLLLSHRPLEARQRDVARVVVLLRTSEWYVFSDHGPTVATFED